jgi:sortase A
VSAAADPARPPRRRAQPLPREPERPGRGERLRRGLRGLSTVLITAGALMVADAALTVAWQEPVTAVVARLDQGGLRDDLRALRSAGPSELELQALAGLETEPRRLAFLAGSLERRTRRGTAIARLRIPAIGVDQVVVKGAEPAELRHGPGLYEGSPLPGAPGTVAVAGHRTTYGAPFRRLDDLRPGQEVTVDVAYGSFTYRVEGSRIVDPADVTVLRSRRYDRLVLTACHPLYSAAQRIVVFARLVATRPGEAARGRSTEPAS